MRRLAYFIMIFAALALLCFLLMWLAINVLWRPEGAEAPEVRKAKIAASLAAIQRDQDNSQWWQTFIQFVAIVILLAAVYLVGSVAIAFNRSQELERRMKIARLRMDYQIVKADQNGNYPLINIGVAGEYYRAEPGNPSVPQPVQLLPAEKGKPPQATRPPMVIYRDRNPLVTVEAEPEPEPVEPVEPEPDYSQEFIDAIKRGESASKAIPAITGVARNGKEPYLTYKLIFDELKERITQQ